MTLQLSTIDFIYTYVKKRGAVQGIMENISIQDTNHKNVFDLLLKGSIQ